MANFGPFFNDIQIPPFDFVFNYPPNPQIFISLKTRLISSHITIFVVDNFMFLCHLKYAKTFFGPFFSKLTKYI